LECTSQQAPFGYISRLAGHDALVVGNDKIFFYALPNYPLQENEEINRLQIQVDTDDTGLLTVYSTSKNEEFEGLYSALDNATPRKPTIS
jgi:hypothetical protein